MDPLVFSDERGFFYESYNQNTFSQILGEDINFTQDNHSCSIKNVIRGLHFQKNPHPQGKLVRCTNGEIYDVAIDIRPESPTFGQWESFHLSAENKKQLWIPIGFAHGFMALSDHTEIQYKTTDFYYPELEICIKWNDPTLGIKWPTCKIPIISGKDNKGQLFSDLFPCVNKT